MTLNRMGRLTRNIPGILLLLVVLVPGVTFRFARISQQGPRLWDEGIYLKEARFLYTFVEAVWKSSVLKGREVIRRENLWRKDEQVRFIRDHLRGSAPIFGRVTYDATLAMGMLGWGLEDPAVGARVNAVAGSLSIVFLYLLARRLYGGRAAFFSTLIFSLMGYHIHYSRSTMAETVTLLFIVLAFHFYAASRTLREHLSSRALALAALFLGLAFTTHNRMIVMWGLFVLYEATLWLFKSPGQTAFRLKRFLVFQLFFFIPLAAWEMPYYLTFLVTKHLDIVVSAPTYFEQVLVALGRSALWGYISKAYRPEGFLTFPYLYLKSCGLIPLVLTFAGFLWTLRRRSFPDLLVTSWFLVPFAFYSFTTAGLSRIFTVLLPATALLSGSLFSSDSKEFWFPRLRPESRSFWIHACLIFLLFGNGLYYGWRQVGSQDGYAAAAHWLRDEGARRILTTNVPVMEVYFGENRVAKSPPASPEELKRLFDEGNTFFVMDYNKPLYALYQKERVDVMESVASKRSPRAVFPNPFVRSPLTMFEANLFFWDTLKYLQEVSSLGLDTIQIYDLRDAVLGSDPAPKELVGN